MGRTSSSKHPVAIIRGAAGKTGKQFADLIGVSEALINQIERGKRALTEDVAWEIQRRTGAASTALLEGRVETTDGTCFSNEAFRAHEMKQTGPHWDSAGILSYMELVLDLIESGDAPPELKVDIVSALLAVVQKYRLKNAINKEMEARPEYIDHPVPALAIRNNPKLAKYIEPPLPVNCKVADLNVFEQVTLRIPLDHYPRMWAGDLAQPPPPRAASSFNLIRTPEGASIRD